MHQDAGDRHRQLLRLLLVAVVLPASILFLSELALRYAAREKWSLPSGLLVYGLMVGQVALLSMAVGKLLDSWPWRLVVVGWALALVHFTLYRAVFADVGWGWRHNPTILLAYAFASAEISAVTAWAILGGLAWPLRLPIAGILCAAIVWANPLSESYVNPWLSAFELQIFAVVVLSLALYDRGYRIRHSGDAATPSQQKPEQFTIMHLFVWTTTMGALIGLLRLADLMDPALRSLSGETQWLRSWLLGGCFAMTGLAAFWTTLGAGHWALRMPVFVTLAVIAGLAARWSAPTFDYVIFNWGWLVWTALAQSFLAALLLMFRCTGYRLLRTGRSP